MGCVGCDDTGRHKVGASAWAPVGQNHTELTLAAEYWEGIDKTPKEIET